MSRLIALLTNLVIQLAYCEVRRLRREQRECLDKHIRMEIEDVRTELAELVDKVIEQKNRVWESNKTLDNAKIGGTD